MAGLTDLLGSILQQGMGGTAGKRMGTAIERSSGGSLEGVLGKLAKEMEAGETRSQPLPDRSRSQPKSAPQSSPGADPLGGLLGQVLGGLGDNPAVKDGIGALLGALVGGGQQPARGSMGSGGLAVLASLAMAALQKAGEAPRQTPRALMAAAEPAREQALEEDAAVIVRAMINAAKADGNIGQAEIDRIVGKLDDDGLSEAEKNFFIAEARRPLDLDAVIASAGGQPEMAAQIYAASLLAVEVDTQAEKQYLQHLAAGLGLHPEVALHIQRSLGVS